MPLSRRAFLNGTGYLLAAASLPSAAAQRQPPRFRTVALPLLAGCDYNRVESINNKGQAVGMCSAGPFTGPNEDSETHAALWDGGKVVDLLHEQFPSPQAIRINNKEQVLLSGPYRGWDAPKRIPEYRVLWDGKVKQMWHATDSFLPDAINNLGEMAGRTKGGSKVAFCGADGKVVPIEFPSKGFANRARFINDNGQVTGTFYNDVTHIAPSLFMWRDGKLGTIIANSYLEPGSRVSYASGAMNEKGKVAGTVGVWPDSLGDTVTHLFVWESMGIIDKGVLGKQGSAHGLNSKGMIVGEGDWPFLLFDGKMLDLNSLLPQDSGWTVQEAVGINDRGQIVANGKLHRKDRAFLLTPVA